MVISAGLPTTMVLYDGLGFGTIDPVLTLDTTRQLSPRRWLCFYVAQRESAEWEIISQLHITWEINAYHVQRSIKLNSNP